VADELDTLNLTKSLIVGYLIVFALLLRVSHLLLLPVVAIAGSPIFAIYHCIWAGEENPAQNA